jgi:TPR repeat protein
MTLLAEAYETGEGVAKDLEKSQPLRRRLDELSMD